MDHWIIRNHQTGGGDSGSADPPDVYGQVCSGTHHQWLQVCGIFKVNWVLYLIGFSFDVEIKSERLYSNGK